jgi:hypothetical protein
MTYIPQYPVYVISKGRAENALTPNFLIQDKVPFFLVVEPQELELYAAKYDRTNILVLPFSNLGLGSIPARNWVWEHAKEAGHKRHWILDDNIACVRRLYKGKRIRVKSGISFKAIEDFTDRYENIAISGMNYSTFVGLASSGINEMPPFYLNTHVYSVLLILNELPNRWRGRYNEDTDLSLRVLKDGLCTIQFNVFLCGKITTQRMKGGNTDEFYDDEGTLPKSQMLANLHPDVAKVVFKFNRWHHHVDYSQFKKNKLIKIVDTSSMPKINNYGMELI